MITNKPEVVLPELARRAIPFLRDEGANYEDDGSNEPLELAREIEAALAADTLTRPADGEFVMVPREATPEMISAGAKVLGASFGLQFAYTAMLSAAPQQHGQEVRTCMNPCSHIDFFNGRACDKCLGTIFSPANFRVQQPAEAVAVDEAWADFAGVYLGDDEGEATLDTVRLCRMAFDAGQRATPPPAIDIGKSGKESGRADNLVSHMVQRFLGWRLPENFGPDCGIKFERLSNVGTEWERQNEPTGTNLLDAEQARAMFAYCIEGHDAEEDYYVIQRLSNLLAQIAVAINGPEPPLNRWSYHDLPEKVRALKTIDIGKLRDLAKWMRARADGGWTGKHQPVSAATLRIWAGTIDAALIGDGGEAGNG